jgi:hypothetical protein
LDISSPDLDCYLGRGSTLETLSNKNHFSGDKFEGKRAYIATRDKMVRKSLITYSKRGLIHT